MKKHKIELEEVRNEGLSPTNATEHTENQTAVARATSKAPVKVDSLDITTTTQSTSKVESTAKTAGYNLQPRYNQMMTTEKGGRRLFQNRGNLARLVRRAGATTLQTVCPFQPSCLLCTSMLNEVYGSCGLV